MEQKEFQVKTLNQIKLYLEKLTEWQTKNEQVVKAAGQDAALDVPQKAWDNVVGRSYISKKDGMGRHLPNFCLKIPTGGGKTFIAVKTIDLVNTTYLKKRTGLILWIVPTNQIYRQTFQSLKNRDHPYRQHLDIASGGRTTILEKTDRFTPQDVQENLVVLMLMLPSASRQDKETLKVFKDSGGFQQFFPLEDNAKAHKELLKKYPNLDTYGTDEGFFGKIIKTSLGNTLRILSPTIILDEGHKAYSETAQKTIRGFNPGIVVELSATPNKDQSNILIEITGAELAREEMVKLDLHLINKASTDWKDTLLATVEKQKALEKKTNDYEASTGKYIRPICLIQAERTGKDQRTSKFIHSEDVREHLIKVCGIPETQVAVKTSEKDELKDVDDVGGLMSRDCHIRYIITKQALQEGWDCAFAYVLTILTNPSSKNGLTQLVGRILRQPEATKTKVKELDESYVFCFHQKGQKLLESVRAGFQREGLGDLSGRIITDDDAGGGGEESYRTVKLRDRFKKFAGKIYLPVFVIRDNSHWRKVSYEMDIISRIDWTRADFSPIHGLSLSTKEQKDTDTTVGISKDSAEVITPKGISKLGESGLTLDMTFVSRHLLDIVPNPWIAYEIGKKVIDAILKKWDEKTVVHNLVFIIEKLREHAEKEKDRMAQIIFGDLIDKETLKFLLLRDDPGHRLPSKINVLKSSKSFNKEDGMQLQASLFDFVAEEGFNETEKTVAWYLEDQERLLWWYRNLSRQDYAIQGWRKHKIYPDFIFTDMHEQDNTEYDKIFVVETKGLHLKNEDTKYKKDVFDICNRMAEKMTWSMLGADFKEKKVRFDVLYEDEWRNEMNKIFNPFRRAKNKKEQPV